MAYVRTVWKNREVERPRTYEKIENPDGTITLIPSEGTIIEEGTPIIAANMNNIEDGIVLSLSQIGDINDETLPAELKGKPLTEQILYVLQHAGKVKSVNGKIGAVILSASDVGAVPTSRKVNNKALTSDITISASDVGAVPTSRKVNNKALTSDITINVSDIAGLVSSKLALGSNASAAGNYSVAIGYDAGTTASGTNAIALGHNARAANTRSVALGAMASASGTDAIALGAAAAIGKHSVAIGYDATASNNNEGILGGTGSSGTSLWNVPGTFFVQGTKNFEIPHPRPEKSATHVIRHGAVESPTPGDTLYRWKIQATKDNDLVTIDLPDYFVWLNKDVQIFVTPQGHFGNGYGDLNRETEQLEIHCQYEGEYNVLVIGTRNDDHPSVQEWSIKGVEREVGESWTGETYAFSVDEILEVEEIKEVSV